jgi:4-hydroxybenzoate polyprenyltransferase
MNRVRSYLSLVKFSHTIFAMPFAMIGFVLGLAAIRCASFTILPYGEAQPTPGFPDGDFPANSLAGRICATGQAGGWLLLRYFLLVIACMVFARNAAMAFNRYLDRRFDALNPRTAIREIPRGIITPGNALGFTIANSLLFIAAAYFINPLCFYLSPVALAVVLGYSYTKRFTSLCHLVLGLGLSLAPIGAYIAVTGRFDLLPLLFSAAVLCWVSGFDIIYALQDVEFDRSQQLKSIPALLGKQRGLLVSRLLHFLSAGLIVFAWWLGGFGWVYLLGAAVFTGMLIYQHSLVRANDLSRVNLAFMTANGIASVVFAIFVIADLFLDTKVAL